MSLKILYQAYKREHDFWQRVAGACLVADRDITNEDVGTANHANRILWTQKDPKVRAIQMLADVLENATIAADPEGCTDNDVQFVVNSHIDTYATGD